MVANSFDLDSFQVRYVVEGLLVNVAPLHIGVGRGLEALGSIENPHIRIRGEPYIPGSSLKGVLRAEAERYAKGVLGERVCDVFDVESRRSEEDNPCIVCQIFGNTGVASHIYVSDAYPESGVTTSVKPGVGINRVTGAAHPGVLYDLEVIDPGFRFRFRMVIENISLDGDEDGRSKVIRFLLWELRNGLISVGGRRSTGLGVLELREGRVSKITVDREMRMLRIEKRSIDEYAVVKDVGFRP